LVGEEDWGAQLYKRNNENNREIQITLRMQLIIMEASLD
jgi:hypothetical protein